MHGDLPMAGGCSCGEIRYVITRPLRTAYICYCHLCQKRTGSAFSFSVVVDEDGFRIEQGSPMRTERRRPDGRINTSWVCPTCFSRIHTRRDGAKTLNVRAGTLDDTCWIQPVAQFWTSSAQRWAVIPEGVLTYDTQPTDFAPLREAWKARYPDR